MVKWCGTLPFLGAVFLSRHTLTSGSPMNVDSPIVERLQQEIDRLRRENTILRESVQVTDVTIPALPDWFEATKSEPNFISV
jgi:hypothetical protein